MCITICIYTNSIFINVFIYIVYSMCVDYIKIFHFILRLECNLQAVEGRGGTGKSFSSG